MRSEIIPNYNLEPLNTLDPQVFNAIVAEKQRQRDHIELIASENFTFPAVLEVVSSILTNKYAEGYPHKRYYGGCEHVDSVEALAIERAKKLFNAEHANVQPHAGSQANIATYFGLLELGDKLMTMSLEEGGHLSHGHPKNLSGKYFNVVHYALNPITGYIDYDLLEAMALEERPKMITVGASAYPREIDFERMGKIAKRSGALLMADIAHIAGLVAAGEHPSPFPHADVVTSTTHKTLRGPRGGLIMCKKEYAAAIDSAVFPGTQGGPLMHAIAAKAICFLEAAKPSFKEYQIKIKQNAKALASVFLEKGYHLCSGGTDNHLILIDLRHNFPNLTGKEAQSALDKAHITLNRNTVPKETRSPFQTSGIRLGSPAMTTRGMGEKEMIRIAGFIDRILQDPTNETVIQSIRTEVIELCKAYPLY